MGCNVLAVRPGVVVVVDGAPKVRKALEARGVEVHAYDGTDLSPQGRRRANVLRPRRCSGASRLTSRTGASIR